MLPAAIAAVLAAAIVPFLPALSAGFSQFDDPGVITEYEGYRALDGPHLAAIFTDTHMGHYQPLTWLSYALEYQFWGLDARGYHATNIALHAISSVLVLLLALRLLRARDPRPCLELGAPAGPGRGPGPRGPALLGATIAAVLFAVHPLRVESVAWITERRDVLSACLLLSALLAYLRAFPAGSSAQASGGWYIASIALLFASLLAKAIGMTLFAVLLILDFWPLCRLPARPRDWLGPRYWPVLIQKLPYAVLGVLSAIVATQATLSMPGTTRSLARWGVLERACQAAYGLRFYLQKLVWPTQLSPLYELPVSVDPLDAPWLVSFAFVAVLALALLVRGRFRPAFLAATACYAVLLSPVLGLFQSGPQLVADRYSYLAHIPWAILIGVGAMVLARARPARWIPLAAGAAAAACTLGALSWRQAELWGSTERLFAHGIQGGADGPVIRTFYGRQLQVRGAKEEALAQYEEALRHDLKHGEAWFSRGNILRDLGRFPEAEQSYKQAIGRMDADWKADVQLGKMFFELNRPKDAAAAFRDAIAKVEAPGATSFSPLPYYLLAGALDELGDQAGCRAMLEKAARYPETRAMAEEMLHELGAPAAPVQPRR